MNFSNAKPYGEAPKTVQTAFDVARNSVNKSRQILQPWTSEPLPYQLSKDLKFILGLGRSPARNMHASNSAVRLELIDAQIELFLNLWREGLERELHFLTIAPDAWHVSENHPVLELGRWRRQTSRWMAKVGLTGLAIIEFAPFLNHPAAEDGRIIAPHVHAIGYPSDPANYRRRCYELRDELGRNSLGLPCLVDKAIAPTEADVAMVGEYVEDQLHNAQNVVPRDDELGTYKVYKAPLPGRLAMRMAELQSYLSFRDLAVSHGRAALHWKNDRFAALGDVGVKQDTPFVQPEALRLLWRTYWRSRGVKDYDRVQVIR